MPNTKTRRSFTWTHRLGVQQQARHFSWKELYLSLIRAKGCQILKNKNHKQHIIKRKQNNVYYIENFHQPSLRNEVFENEVDDDEKRTFHKEAIQSTISETTTKLHPIFIEHSPVKCKTHTHQFSYKGKRNYNIAWKIDMTQLFQFSCYESKWVFVKINKISYRFMR